MATDQQISQRRLNLPEPAPGFAVWFTGLPASGKTTLARDLQHLLFKRGVQVIILDSDELRQMLISQSTYSPEERDWFYGVVARLAAWLTANGINVLIAATANRRAYRQAARLQIDRFAEVFVVCSFETCRQRDPKGLYAAAQTGRTDQLPGEGAIYEPPLQPDVIIDTDTLQPAEAAEAVLAQLAEFWS